MKFRSIFFIVISSFCSIALWAMSPEERAEFKRQLKTAATSAKMEDMVRDKLNFARPFALQFSNKADKPVEFIKKYVDWPGESEMVEIVEECFFEDMEPYLFQDGDIDVEKKKFEKYRWANDDVVNEVAKIFFAQESRATGPGHLVNKYNYIKKRCGQLTGHHVPQDSFSSAFLNKAFRAIEQDKNKLMLLATIAVLGGLYYCWAKISDKQNNEDEVAEDEQATAQNDLNNGESNEST